MLHTAIIHGEGCTISFPYAYISLYVCNGIKPISGKCTVGTCTHLKIQGVKQDYTDLPYQRDQRHLRQPMARYQLHVGYLLTLLLIVNQFLALGAR